MESFWAMCLTDDKRIEELERLVELLVSKNKEMAATIDAQSKCIRELRAKVGEQSAKIGELEDKWGKNSKNSSKPSSTDQKANMCLSKGKTQRPFRSGASRKRLPEKAVTSREVRRFHECPCCGSSTESTDQVRSWQQVDLTQLQLFVHQVDLVESQCTHCQKKYRPKLLPHEKYLCGPHFEAIIHYCLVEARVSHQRAIEFLTTLHPHLRVSKGLISKIKKRGAGAFAPVAEEIRNTLLSSHAPTHVDATGWRDQGNNVNLIVIRSGWLIYFSIQAKQNGSVIAELLKGRVTHLVSDRGLAAQKMTYTVHPFCLAHLIRNLVGLCDKKSTSLEDTASLGYIHDLIQLLFHDHHRLDRKEIKESTWRHYGYQTWGTIEDELRKLSVSKNKVGSFCRRVLKRLDNFKVFLRSPLFPMTNNPAEEALRPGVIARKLSYGSRSVYGKLWRACCTSCFESLKRKVKPLIHFVALVIDAHRKGQDPPSILAL